MPRSTRRRRDSSVMRAALLAAPLAALASLPAQAVIYRSVDARGQVTYSDQPRPGAVPIELDFYAGQAAVPEGPPPPPSAHELQCRSLEAQLREAQRTLRREKLALAKRATQPPVRAAALAAPGDEDEARHRLEQRVLAQERIVAELRGQIAEGPVKYEGWRTALVSCDVYAGSRG